MQEKVIKINSEGQDTLAERLEIISQFFIIGAVSKTTIKSKMELFATVVNC